ncbi:MAG: UDP-N-acetylmuramoyl-L-alanyl-D-glutamate--2,6-diaminopimelate ligase [Porticoccaceae bacterium]
MAARTPGLAPRLTDLLPGLRLPRDAVVTGLCLDSRRCAPGDAFVALPGGSHDGRRHIAEAVARGCGAVIAEDRDFDALVTGPVAVPLARVANLHRELSAIAGRFHGEPAARLRISAVTGTNGKTTCSYLLGQLLALLGEPAAIIGTLGHGRVGEGREGFEATGMTTPDALATQRILAGFVEQGVQVVAMEVSSHSLDQYRVAALPFDTAIFTNLSRDHLDYHGTLAAYGAAKARLFKWPGLRHAVINADDPFGRQLLADLPAGVDAIGYGLSTAAAVRVGDVTFGHGGVSARVFTPWGEGLLRSPLLGEFNLANLLAVVAAACAQGHPLARVLALVPALRPVTGRMEVVDPGAAPQVVVDYAHTPDALEKALLALRRHCAGRLWCVFGCGGDRDPGKRPEMGAIAARLADGIVVTSDNPRSEPPGAIIDAILAGIPAAAGALAEPDRRAAIAAAIAAAAPEDTVLIAGKGHEDYQLVGAERLPFSDQAEARLALRRRREVAP